MNLSDMLYADRHITDAGESDFTDLGVPRERPFIALAGNGYALGYYATRNQARQRVIEYRNDLLGA